MLAVKSYCKLTAEILRFGIIMFSKFKFVTGNPNKVREAGEILGLALKSVQVDGIFEIQTPDLNEVVRHKA